VTHGRRPAGLVLVVEDDDTVRAALQRGLAVHGFDVGAVADAEGALPAIAARRPDVLVVDVGLPGLSGIELCERLRQLSVDLPVLILSARDRVGDRVAGLAAGADDYLVKPFDLEELALRLRALLRRAGARTAGAALAAGPLWVDPDRRAASVGGRPVELTRREFDLLAAFVANAGLVLGRYRLLELVWGYDFDVDTNVVDVFVGYLRRKLAAAGAPDLIHTVRGVGFVLRAG
jgi:two-component system response regulator PrrA